MTDEEILVLIEQTPSEQWTVDQIETVRQRLTTSSTLRRAMSERLRFDDVLSVTFDAEHLRPEKIVAAAASLLPKAKKPTRRRWSWGIALGLVVAISAVTWKWWPDDSFRLSGIFAPGETTPAARGNAADAEYDTGKRSHDSAIADGKSPGDPTVAARTNEPPKATEPDDVPASSVVAVATDTPRPAAELEPWAAARRLGGPPRPFETVAFFDVGDAPLTPRRDELRRWLLGLPGIRLDVQERDINGRRCATFDGVGRLAAPWPDDAMLRMALRDANKLRIYLWHGARGVMLHYHEDRRFAWAAYVVGRDDREPKPESYALAATDDQRGFRTSQDGQATFDIYWRDGAIVLARGGIQLLAAPLDAPPEEVIFDGRACFLGLTMTRASDLPPPSVLPPPTIVEPTPAQLKWQATTPTDSQFTLTNDGQVELSSTKSNAPAQAFTAALPSSNPKSLYEIVCRIDAATPGASVFVADDAGNHAEVLRFMRENANSALGVWVVNSNDGRRDANENLDNGPAPLVGAAAWIRIVCGGGAMRAWLSPDGVHWASPWRLRGGGAPRRFGISLWPGESPRRIVVGQLAWRELTGLSALAPTDLIATAATKSNEDQSENQFDQWRQRVNRQRPPQADEDEWQRAAAVAALIAGANGELGRDLVTYLIEESPRVDLSLDVRASALNDLSLLCDTWDDPRRARQALDFYASLASQPHGEPLERPYSALAATIAASPIVTSEPIPPDVDALARLEILRLVDAGRWAELDQLCRVVRFREDRPGRERRNDQRRDGSLVDWAQTQARHHVPGVAGEPPPITQPLWRDILVEQFDTDAFNVLAEFQAAIEGQAFRDAAETIAMAGGKLVESTDTLGVLPDDKQQGLYVSLRVAVEQAMRDHAGLESAMQERFGPTARLRVQRAIADENLSAIEAATLQYHGTVAAAEAHIWLGNRALSAGEFSRAAGHFREAAESADANIAAEARHRLRLSAALAGRAAGEAASAAVEIGERRLAAGEFERIVAQMIARSADALVESDATKVKNRPQVAAADFAVQKRGEFRLGPFGRPRTGGDDGNERFAVDWFARSASLSAFDDVVLINGRTTAAAFDTQTGLRRWEATLRGPPADANSWPLCCASPLAVGDRVFLRWQAKNGPVLVCLDKADGRIVWQSHLGDDHLVVGDPFYAQDELFALVVRPDALQQYWQLSLVDFDTASGQPIRTRPLVRLNDAWRELSVCQATVSRDRLFVSLGGVVLCADLSGQVHWVRTLPHVPPNVDRWSYVQMHDPPIVADDRVFVATPTVRRVVCLDAASGRLVWQRGEVDLVQLVALAGDRLVIRNSNGLVGLNASDGTPQWRYDVEGQCEVLLGGDSHATLVVAEETSRVRRRRPASGPAPIWASPTLAWIDPATGEVRGTWANRDWSVRGGQFGPVAVSSQGRIWGLRGENGRAETRDVVELFPPGVAVPPATATEPTPPPTATAASGELQKAADKTLAGWTVDSGAVDPAGALVKHLESDDTVLAIADRSRAVVFSQQVTLPAQSKGRLRIKAGYAAGERWTIHVAAGERTLLDATIGATADGNDEPGWQRFELELEPIAGQATTLTVTASSPDEKPRQTLWKRLQVNP
ncbi:MAG: PQQ-binding-like beta-propeller repeat protein [Pirellulales bacterium]